MRIAFIFFISMCCGAIHFKAQSGFTNLGGASFLGFGRAGVNISGIESIYFNQAGLADIDHFAIDVSFERRFNLEELTQISIAVAKSYDFGTFGLMVSQFGFQEYNEQKFGLAYAKKLMSQVSIGGQFDLLRYNVLNFGHKNIFTFELGIQYKIHKSLSMAAHIFNPGNIEINEFTNLASRFRTGIKYAPSDKVFLLLEVEKAVDQKLEYRFGLGYQIIKTVQCRMGVNPTIGIFSFGCVFQWNDAYKLGGAMATNNPLGNSSAFTLQYNP